MKHPFTVIIKGEIEDTVPDEKEEHSFKVDDKDAMTGAINQSIDLNPLHGIAFFDKLDIKIEGVE